MHTSVQKCHSLTLSEYVSSQKGNSTTKSSAAAGRTSLKKGSTGTIVQNARITVGKAGAVDITFVPKTVGSPQHLLRL